MTLPQTDTHRGGAAMMRAAVVAAPGEIRIETVPVPVCGPNEVRFRLEGCGVCASNLPPWQGAPWFLATAPASAFWPATPPPTAPTNSPPMPAKP
jgi:hypothetical protein